ncbi:MAG: CPBP family intramembrane metalloprotease [Ruminococcus flavefaciens]|nr:CPBP family intramembrane metalloprotease [Ruminococcus flavefaciens]MCM1230396.1 CPBP family intramembrane metalloprotease [Ruminococcus flavefaciens]
MNATKNLRKASNVNSGILLLWTVLILIFTAFSEPITELFVSSESANYEYLQSLLIFLFQYIIDIPILLLIFGKSNKIPKLKPCFRKSEMPAKWVFRWIFISLFLVYTAGYISNIFFNILQYATGIELHTIDMSADDNALSRITNIVAMMFLAPFFEEILFRGTLLRNSVKYGSWTMIIIMGIMFGLWHCNYEQTLYTATLGVCAGFLIVKTKSIIPSILLHFCLNTVGAVSSLFVGDIDTGKILAEDSEYIMSNLAPIIVTVLMGFLTIAIMITGLVFFILEIINRRDSFKLKKNDTEVSGIRTAVSYFTSPVTLITTLIFIALTVINAI